jgi:hypothetical protein
MPGNRIGSLQAIGDIFGATDFFNFIAELKSKCQLIAKSQWNDRDSFPSRPPHPVWLECDRTPSTHDRISQRNIQ